MNKDSFWVPVIIILLIGILSGFTAKGQDLEKRISLSLQEVPVSEVLQAITEKTGLKFSYSPQLAGLKKRISVNLRDAPLREVFDQVFHQNGIAYLLVEGQVVLKSPEEGKEPLPGTTPPVVRKFTISGFLRDKSSGEVLIGAAVYAEGSQTGAVTNAFGFYSLTLPEDRYTLQYSYLGYRSVKQEIDLRKNLVLPVDLEENTVEMNAVDIVGDKHDRQPLATALSDVHFTPRILTALPGFAGDIDVIKALQAVPGIKSYGDGSTMFYVRGGNSDQNLIMMDDAPIYNPSHLFGFFSAFAPDAIKEAEAYKGDFPASYGGRLSSVIDIRSKDGNMKKHVLSGSVGPFTTDISFEGPLVKERSSCYLSARRSNLNWMQTDKIADKSLDISFYDVNGKFNFKANNNNRFYLTLYTGKDEFSSMMNNSIHTFGISWDNLLGTVRWNHVFNNKLFSNTTAYISRYNYYLFISRQLDDYWTSSITNKSLKSDFTWYPSPGNTVKIGGEIRSYYSNPGNVHFSDPDVQSNVPEISQYHSAEYSGYFSNDLKISNKLGLYYGFRLALWLDLGPATVNLLNSTYGVAKTYEVSKNHQYAAFLSPEPRVSLRYTLNSFSSLKAGYHRNTQFIQQLSNSESPFTSLEVWAPCGPNILPQHADLYTTGYFLEDKKKGLNLSLEGFYKHLSNQIEYRDHANMLYNQLIEGELRFGKAWSYGIELMLRKDKGKFNGWIGYTWSRVFKKIQDVNSGGVFPALHDRPHDICVNLSWVPTQRFSASVNWIYLTGAPTTTPIGFYNYNGYNVPVYGEKNNGRLPDYHRLDLLLNLQLNRTGNRYQHRLILAVFNAYGRYNAFAMTFNKISDGKGNFVVPSNQNGENVIVPTSISAAGVVPSLTYKFKF